MTSFETAQIVTIGNLLDTTADRKLRWPVLLTNSLYHSTAEQDCEHLAGAVRIAAEIGSDPGLFQTDLVRGISLQFSNRVGTGAALHSINAFPNRNPAPDAPISMQLDVSRGHHVATIANMIDHEVTHAQQKENVRREAKRDPAAFHWKGQADLPYLKVVAEGCTFASQAVGAVILLEHGHPEAWYEFSKGDSDGQLAGLVLDECARRNWDLRSDNTKRMLFDAWMTDSMSNRMLYEHHYINLASKEDREVHSKANPTRPGLSLTNQQLATVAKDSSGYSYLDGANLLGREYATFWHDFAVPDRHRQIVDIPENVWPESQWITPSPPL